MLCSNNPVVPRAAAILLAAAPSESKLRKKTGARHPVVLDDALFDLFEFLSASEPDGEDASMGWLGIASGVPESPIEEAFTYHLHKYLVGNARLDLQVKVETLCGSYRIDAVVTLPGGRRIAFECDGKGFHDPIRDEWRDAMILGSAGIERIYRLRGRDLNFRLFDVLLVIAAWNRDLFPPRGHTIIRRLASEEILAGGPLPRPPRCLVSYRYGTDGEETDYFDTLDVEVRGAVPGRELWRRYFEFVRRNGLIDLDQAIELWAIATRPPSRSRE